MNPRTAFALTTPSLFCPRPYHLFPPPRSNPLSFQSPPKRCQITMKPLSSRTENLIKRAVNRGVEKSVAEKVVSLAERALRDWTCTSSDFLTPPESAAMVQVLSTVADLKVGFWGGYDDAERGVVLMGHAEVAESGGGLVEMAGGSIALLKVVGKFEFEKASHRDFMGAILNAGLTRAKIGDIIVLDSRGAEVLVSEDVVEFLQGAVTSIRNVGVKLERVALEDLEMPLKRMKELQSVESSLRLDAIVSAGFKLSRSKLADMARSGLVFVNYKEVKAPAKNLKTGDIVSVRGIGKLEIGTYSTTSKGRYRIEMKRYI